MSESDTFWQHRQATVAEHLATAARQHPVRLAAATVAAGVVAAARSAVVGAASRAAARAMLERAASESSERAAGLSESLPAGSLSLALQRIVLDANFARLASFQLTTACCLGMRLFFPTKSLADGLLLESDWL